MEESGIQVLPLAQGQLVYSSVRTNFDNYNAAALHALTRMIITLNAFE